MLRPPARACLIVALAVCLYGIGASLYGARAGRREYVALRPPRGLRAGRRAGRRDGDPAGGVRALGLLVRAGRDPLLDDDAALLPADRVWSSQEGSLLLWVLLLALWSSAILFLTRRRLREVAPYATAVLLGFGAFFCGLLVFLESPFDAGGAARRGRGAQPAAAPPEHDDPPPRCCTRATRCSRCRSRSRSARSSRGGSDAEWIRGDAPVHARRWFLLGFGIVLGARWSYSELGWGGYWAWDPVENASLMPWLTGTAFLHSVMIQEKRGMLKVWNVSLVLATGVLAILGTFLVRSGILESIHAFGASTLGVPFLVLIVAMIGGSIALVASRAESLRSEHRLDSLLSREAAFLLNNLVLVALCFVVFWGTFFPLISEAVTGEEASVGPPWFDRYITPLALVLVLLSGIGPLIAWRRATAANLRRNFALPVGAGARSCWSRCSPPACAARARRC